MLEYFFRVQSPSYPCKVCPRMMNCSLHILEIVRQYYLLRSEASQMSFNELCGAEGCSLLKRVTFLYLGFVFTFSLFTFSISRTHGTEKEQEQPDWRKYRLPLEM